MKLRFFIATDDQAPASGQPTGVSVLADYGQVDYIVGDDDEKDMNHDVLVDTGGSYLKVHAENDDFYDHAVDVHMELEPIEAKE